MNFFEQQDRARGTTQKLVLLFALAVISLIVVTTLLVMFALGLAAGQDAAPASVDPALFVSDVFVAVSALVLGVVLLGALFRMAQLRGGGHVVAEGLGGRLLQAGTQDADERKVLNVVEEMAIAAGMPVPAVYLLEDDAINAFAAGLRPEDAVIGITRGCIHLLDRDELQGVVAHEFSHIFNGDMRLNIRLIGWLYGIMVIGMIGYYVLRGSRYSFNSSRRKNGGGILVLALGLVIIGYGGTFFGNLIKAAVSRQREFLADASAVQFTRNPGGIGGALKKIAAHSEGSLLRSADAAEVSHMLFGQGVKAGFTGLLATHPPLQERIRRIEPHWDGVLPQARAAQHAAGMAPARRTPPGVASIAADASGAPLDRLADALVASVAEPDAAQLQQATAVIAALPVSLRHELREPLGASLLMHALLLRDAGAETNATAMLQQTALTPAAQQQLLQRCTLLQDLPRTQYLTLVELAVPALKQLSPAQRADFFALQQALIRADGSQSLFEWCLARVLQRYLLPATAARRSASATLERSAAACSQLLSALAWTGAGDAAQVESAFAAGKAALGLPLALLPQGNAMQPDKLDHALQGLQQLKPLQKPRLLKALVACIAHDGRLQAVEGELLRVVALLLDCPLPPLPPALLQQRTDTR